MAGSATALRSTSVPSRVAAVAEPISPTGGAMVRTETGSRVSHPRYVTVTVYAGRAAVDPSTVSRWLRAGTLRGSKPNGHRYWRIPWSQYEQCRIRGEMSET